MLDAEPVALPRGRCVEQALEQVSVRARVVRFLGRVRALVGRASGHTSLDGVRDALLDARADAEDASLALGQAPPCCPESVRARRPPRRLRRTTPPETCLGLRGRRPSSLHRRARRPRTSLPRRRRAPGPRASRLQGAAPGSVRSSSRSGPPRRSNPAVSPGASTEATSSPMSSALSSPAPPSTGKRTPVDSELPHATKSKMAAKETPRMDD